MVKAEIENWVVMNVIAVDPDNIPDWCINWPTITEGGIGWSWDGTNFVPPVVVEPEVTNDTV